MAGRIVVAGDMALLMQLQAAQMQAARRQRDGLGRAAPK